jgi:hypothetical protein
MRIKLILALMRGSFLVREMKSNYILFRLELQPAWPAAALRIANIFPLCYGLSIWPPGQL